MGALASRAAQEGDALIAIEQRGKPVQIVVRRRDDRRFWQQSLDLRRRRGRCRLQSDVARDDNDRHATLADRFADRDLEDTRHLRCGRHELAIVTAFLEQRLGMCLLEIPAADLGAWDLRGDCEHRHARAVAVKKAVDEVQVAWPAASGTDRELAGQVCLGAGREGADLFVPHMDPLDLALAADSVGQTVQAVTDNPIDPLDASGGEGFSELIRNGCHESCSEVRALHRRILATCSKSAKNLAACAAEILMMRNLMIWNAAIYCAEVGRSNDVAALPEPWFRKAWRERASTPWA